MASKYKELGRKIEKKSGEEAKRIIKGLSNEWKGIKCGIGEKRRVYGKDKLHRTLRGFQRGVKKTIL